MTSDDGTDRKVRALTLAMSKSSLATKKVVAGGEEAAPHKKRFRPMNLKRRPASSGLVPEAAPSSCQRRRR